MAEKEITIPGTSDKWKVVTKEDGRNDKAFLNGKEMTFIPVGQDEEIDLTRMEGDAENPPEGDPSKTVEAYRVCYPIRDKNGRIIGWHCV